MSTEEDSFKYVISSFPSLSFEKIKAGVFDDPKIRQLIRYEHFTGPMAEREKNTWMTFKNLVKDFLGNTRAQNYTKIIRKLLESFKMLSCKMRIKLNFLHSNFADFPKNFGAVSDEQDERFLQDLKLM